MSASPEKVSAFAQATAARQRSALYRSIEIIRWMCAGLCDKRIARQMGISVTTIKKRRQALMRALHVETHAQLGVWAERNGYAPRSESQGVSQ